MVTALDLSPASKGILLREDDDDDDNGDDDEDDNDNDDDDSDDDDDDDASPSWLACAVMSSSTLSLDAKVGGLCVCSVCVKDAKSKLKERRDARGQPHVGGV